MGHKAESENPLRVKMHGSDEAVVVARNVKDDHIPTTGYLNQICRPIHLSQRHKVFELRRLNECQPSRQGRCSGGMFACPQAHGHGLDDFHSLGQNVLIWAFRQERMGKRKPLFTVSPLIFDQTFIKNFHQTLFGVACPSPKNCKPCFIDGDFDRGE